MIRILISTILTIAVILIANVEFGIKGIAIVIMGIMGGIAIGISLSIHTMAKQTTIIKGDDLRLFIDRANKIGNRSF